MPFMPTLGVGLRVMFSEGVGAFVEAPWHLIQLPDTSHNPSWAPVPALALGFTAGI